MNHWDIISFSKDLSVLIKLIEKHEIPIETISLYGLEAKINLARHLIEVDNILFKIDRKISGTLPSKISKISISLSHKCEFDGTRQIATQDPIKDNYHFYIQINGYDDDKGVYINCWRLDQHIDPNTASKFTHPYYHFQSGGDEIESYSTGDIVFMGGPRLPHPPMDLFLGVHFIISNFFSSKDYDWVNNLNQNYEYQEILKRAQKRMWEPYFNSFIMPNNHSDFTFNKVFPLFIN